MAKKILIVEDERAIREMVNFALRREGFKSLEAGSVAEAEAVLKEQVPDLILVDWMLPSVSGVDFVEHVRADERLNRVPIIMLTARVDESSRIAGLDAGADDYICKPFSVRELLARIRACLRREQQSASSVLALGRVKLDTEAHRVSIDDTPLEMGPTEYKLLKFLLCNPDRVYSRAQLLDNIWGRSAYVEERTIDVHVLRLRKVLAPFQCDNMLQTVRGAGYRFCMA